MGTLDGYHCTARTRYSTFISSKCISPAFWLIGALLAAFSANQVNSVSQNAILDDESLIAWSSKQVSDVVRHNKDRVCGDTTGEFWMLDSEALET